MPAHRTQQLDRSPRERGEVARDHGHRVADHVGLVVLEQHLRARIEHELATPIDVDGERALEGVVAKDRLLHEHGAREAHLAQTPEQVVDLGLGFE